MNFKMDIGREIEVFFNKINSAYSKFELFKEIGLHYNANKIKNSAGLFNEVLDSLRFSFVIETLKIIDEREQKNIYEFLDNCEHNNDKFLSEIKQVFINNDTNEKEEILIRKVNIVNDINKFKKDLSKFSNQIKNLKLLRDKIYAHNDKEYFYGDKSITNERSVKYQDVEKILNMLHKNLNIISINYNQKAYGRYSDFKSELEYLLK